MMKPTTSLLVVWTIGLLAVTSGCNTYYDPTAVNEFLLPQDMVVSATEYRVMPPDVLSFTTYRGPMAEFQEGFNQQIRPDGKVNLPLIGELYVAGKTPREIEQVILEEARKYYEEPSITVDVASYNSQRYYVFGQVGSPGPKRWTGRDHLLEALAAAQPTQLAWPERIWVVRGDTPQVGGRRWSGGAEAASSSYRLYGVHKAEEGNPRRRLLINLAAMYEDGDLSQNILLKPNDIIWVQPNPFAKVGLAVQNVLFPVRPAVSAVSTPAQFAAAGTLP